MLSLERLCTERGIWRSYLAFGRVPPGRSHRKASQCCRAPPRKAPWPRADAAGRRRVVRWFWAAGWRCVRHASLPVGGRALLPLPALTSRTGETTGRNTAGDLDPAFWHGDSREFEGEATWARAVWGPLIAEELASRLVLGNLQPMFQATKLGRGRVASPQRPLRMARAKRRDHLQEPWVRQTTGGQVHDH